MLAISSRTCLKFCRGVQTFGLQFAAAFGFLSELELVPATFAVHVKNNQSLYFLMHFNIVAVGRMCLDGAAQCGFFFGVVPPAGAPRAKSCRNYQKNTFRCLFFVAEIRLVPVDGSPALCFSLPAVR